MKTIIIFCVLLVCVCTGLLAQQSPTPSGHPLTVLNGSGDGRYLAGEVVSIAGDGAAEGYAFLGWIVLTLNGRVTSWNEQSQFVMPNHASTVAAVYGKVETWFPLGEEKLKAGLLMPKGNRRPQKRTKQVIRVSFSLGDGLSMVKSHDLWWISRVLVDWFPRGEAQGAWGASEISRCFDKGYLGTPIERNQAIPKQSFTEIESGVFEAAVWHESLWTWQQAADKFDEDEEVIPPQLDVRVDLGVSSNQSYFISRMKAAGPLLPFEVISDLNNNGMIDGGDRTAKSNGAKTGATDEEKEKATEYIFANDNLSNGAWDKDDPSSDKPQDAMDDDDAEEISVTCAATWGAVWFEHPAIEKLSFYKSKECKADEKLTFPFALSDQESGKLPEKLYVRLDGTGFTEQAEGDLVMKFGKADKSETWAEDKIKFTAIKQLGDEKFFQAARDYILERNTKLFAHNWGYPVASPSTFIRMCVMREEATTMHPYESYHNDAVVNYNQASPGGTAYFDPVLYAQGLGIEGVMSVDEEMTVVINGNQCAFSNGTGTVEAYAMFLLGEPLMTDKCQGRVVIDGSLNPASNDHYDPATNAPGTSMKGSFLAGPDPIPGTGGPGGKYIAQTGNAFQVGAGVLPAAVNNGMGGLSSSYNLGERSGYPNSMVGYVPMAGDGKGVVFAACGINFSQGNGKVVEFYQAARDSKVPDISGATQSNGMTVINLLLLDSGNTSPALAHQNPSDSLKLLLKGSKHNGNAYYTNTFLRFKSQRPRSTSP